MQHAFAVLLALMVFGPAAAAAAQSLGDVARKEEARRKNVKEAAKVYTNDDLKGSGAAGASTIAPPSTQAPPSPSGAQGQPDPSKANEDTPEEPRKDEAYWRGRVSEARATLERARMFQDALQSRINALGADFAARDDPAQRNQIAAERQKALAELDRVRKEIADSQKAIADLEDEARKAGVPPGWLR